MHQRAPRGDEFTYNDWISAVETKVEESCFHEDVNKFRHTIGNTLYGAILRLVKLNMEKLVTDAEREFY